MVLCLVHCISCMPIQSYCVQRCIGSGMTHVCEAPDKASPVEEAETDREAHDETDDSVKTVDVLYFPDPRISEWLSVAQAQLAGASSGNMRADNAACGSLLCA